MARIRSIKPEFFLDDELADLDPLARLLFVGLWTQADRAGRLKDKPVRIKAAVLPYDDCDCDALLDDLQVAGFIIRYEVGSSRYIQVVNFETHQRFNNESDSVIPALCEDYVSPSLAVIHGREGEGRERYKDKTLSLSTGIDESVLGYWSDKIGREPKDSDLRSLRILCKRYPAETINYAIGQACVQGAPPDNFGLITTIAKGEVS